MIQERRILVVGGDGLIGARLAKLLTHHGDVRSTTRRNDQAGMIYLDLGAPNLTSVLAYAPHIAFLCAGVTNIQTCEDDPDGARSINVDGTLQLAHALLSIGCFVVFLSSNTVFDCLAPFPDEDSPTSPHTVYGQQKSVVEKRIVSFCDATDRVAITRLSKVVTSEDGIVGLFMRRLKSGERVVAFEDLRLSPITLDYVCKSLIEIGTRKQSGVFHLSGDSELSYAQFAMILAERIGRPRQQIVVASSDSAGVKVLFRPKHPALGMERTQRILGLNPEPFATVVNQLFSTKE